MNGRPADKAAMPPWMPRKLGLALAQSGDLELGQDLLDRMAANQADFTLTFRGLAEAVDQTGDSLSRRQFTDPTAFDAWAARWRDRLTAEAVDPKDIRRRIIGANPLYVPRNHRVEQAIYAAVTDGDFAPFERLCQILAHPFDEHPDAGAYADPPEPDEVVRATFCGT
jgi:uncharacterized protein YdiU (UPF0061 family)